MRAPPASSSHIVTARAITSAAGVRQLQTACAVPSKVAGRSWLEPDALAPPTPSFSSLQAFQTANLFSPASGVFCINVYRVRGVPLAKFRPLELASAWGDSVLCLVSALADELLEIGKCAYCSRLQSLLGVDMAAKSHLPEQSVGCSTCATPDVTAVDIILCCDPRCCRYNIQAMIFKPQTKAPPGFAHRLHWTAP